MREAQSMLVDVPVKEDDALGAVSTGSLPPTERVAALVAEAHALFRDVDDGVVADYIPALAKTRPELFGVCVAGVNGAVHTGGTPITSSRSRACPSRLCSRWCVRRSAPRKRARRSA